MSFIFNLFKRASVFDHEQCFYNKKARNTEFVIEGSMCKGEVGGSNITNYLNERCIDCPYLYLKRRK